MKNYGKVLQHEINKIFEFFQNWDNANSIHCIELENINLTRVPRWKQMLKINSQSPITVKLFNHLVSVEIAYRHFELNLIQEILKFI